ncbi:MAG: energy-coupling factor ABC transporter permease [Endomicrobium sp.]|jgi:cobalt/nickel transport system permease protein|nr:energy-coupling factor ABC transporter permease [Endomicrobium sp.]
MHIQDGFLNNNLAGSMFAGAVCMFGYCFGKMLKTVSVVSENLVTNHGNTPIKQNIVFLSKKSKQNFQELALIATWIFAFQMFNVPIQSATSAHIIGGVFAAILAGPFAGFIIMSSVLIVQALFFSDGGLLALGANIFNMALVGSFISYYIYKNIKKTNYVLAVFTACFFSVMGASLSCLAELAFSNTIIFSKAFKDMTTMHLIVSLLESIITLILIKLFKNLNGDINE